jgi:hypothetical protein
MTQTELHEFFLDCFVRKQSSSQEIPMSEQNQAPSPSTCAVDRRHGPWQVVLTAGRVRPLKLCARCAAAALLPKSFCTLAERPLHS